MGEMRRLVNCAFRPVAGGILAMLFTGAVVFSVTAQETVPAKPAARGIPTRKSRR